jgi:RNA polymerase sigma-B factor
MTTDSAILEATLTPARDIPSPHPSEPVHVDPEKEPAGVRRQSRKLAWDKERTAELFRRYRSNADEAARDELITMYLNLVKYLASKFRNRGEPVDDLIQVGTIGLIKAVDRFDTERGWEFTTYATPTIVGEIKRHFRDKGWAIRVPRRLQELSGQVSQAVEALTRKNQCSPTIPQIAEHLGVTTDEVLQAMESSGAYSCSSLDGDVNHDGDSGDGFSILEYIGEDDRLLALVDDRTTLAAALKGLSSQEQHALYLRFFGGLTQTEIAKHLNISQMQVSRLLRKSLNVLRAKLVLEDA